MEVPCPYCENMPILELRNPHHKEYVLKCDNCGLEICEYKKEKCFREWYNNWKRVKEFILEDE